MRRISVQLDEKNIGWLKKTAKDSKGAINQSDIIRNALHMYQNQSCVSVKDYARRVGEEAMQKALKGNQTRR